MENYVAILMSYGDGCTFGVEDVLSRICLKDDIEKNLKEVISENTGLPQDDLIIESDGEDSYGTIAYHVFKIIDGEIKNIFGDGYEYQCYSTQPLVNFMK